MKLIAVCLVGVSIASASADVLTVNVLSTVMRESDPTVMEITYKVSSTNPTVAVRALAFKDGVRSFSNVIRPETFIEGTAENIGDSISANDSHKLYWKVSSDWKVDLSKVKFEVFAKDGDLLPLKLVTIPKTSTHASIQISRNIVEERRVFNVLMWLYACKDPSLSLQNGYLYTGGKVIAYNRALADDCYECGNGGMFKYDAFPLYYSDYDNFWDDYMDLEEDHWRISSETMGSAIDFVYQKMGFRPLVGDEMAYAIRATRLDLRSCMNSWGDYSSGYWPYAVRDR